MGIFTNQSGESRALWSTCLASAFRMALACTIVACTTMYGPASLRRLVAFPAFSYFTVVLTVTDAALGDTIRGCCLALFAIAQSLCPAILVFWVIGPARFSYGTISLAVALAFMVVVLPKSTPLVAKRMALGQIVIVYVVGFSQRVHTQPLMHPIHVAASAAMGATASVLATLLPYPRLASLEVKEKSKVAADNAAARLSLFVKALMADNNTVALASTSKASSLSSSATKLFPIIKRYQKSMQWERLPFKICRSSCSLSGGVLRLQDLEMTLMGMKLALSSIPSYPVEMLQNQVLRDGLNGLEKHIIFTIKQANGLFLFDSLTFPQSNADDILNTVQSIQTIPTNHQNLPPLFFIFCMKLLQDKCQTRTQEKSEQGNVNSEACPGKQTWFSSFKSVVWSDWASQVSGRRLMPALKCTLSLSLAVFLGLMYSEESGFWAGLAVAIGLASGREATFKVANVKAQGTVLGSVYGVLSFFLFERFLPLRLLCLLPWFVFTSFLRRSRMYGPAGGISAVVGAVLILGRKNYGPPSEFAIARIIETFIGLSSSIMVGILLQPTRASKMAKIQLATSLQTLQTCINSLSFRSSEVDLEGKHKTLKMQVNELRKFIEEAEVEPNFWFLPLHSSCYNKLFKSLSKTADFFGFSAYAMQNLEESSTVVEDTWKKLADKLDGDLGKFKEMVDACIKCYADVTSLKSLRMLEMEAEKNDISSDLEMGKPQNGASNNVSDHLDEIETEKLIHSFLQHSTEVNDHIAREGGSEEAKCRAVLNLSALAFCLSSLMRETQEIGEAIRELIQWENPSSHVNLKEITHKLHAFQN